MLRKEEADSVNVCIIGQYYYKITKVKILKNSTFSGSGFSGICMAIKLREAGIDNFRIVEKQPELGCCF